MTLYIYIYIYTHAYQYKTESSHGWGPLAHQHPAMLARGPHLAHSRLQKAPPQLRVMSQWGALKGPNGENIVEIPNTPK